MSSLPTEAYYGIKKFTMGSHIIKIELSFTPSSLRVVWLGCPLWTRKKPKNSNRKWTTEKRMQAKPPRHSHSRQRPVRAFSGMATNPKVIAGWEDLGASCTPTEALAIMFQRSRPWFLAKRRLIVPRSRPTVVASIWTIRP